MDRGIEGGEDEAAGETATATASVTPRTERSTLAGGTRPPPREPRTRELDSDERDAALAETAAAEHGKPSPSDELVGTSIGRYRVLAKLGAGGMGVVYRAIDPALDRTVALKVLPPLDEERRTHLEERLRREAQALARLDHRNVVAVYDVGIAEASLFVAMQYVDGSTLDEYLRAHPLRPRKLLALFVDAGRGLEAAHAAGIIHRDVKPSNILVDRSGRVCVGDFGLARGAAEPAGERALPPSQTDLLVADMTRAGAVLGTPLFMAPEQHRGEPATARSDQFSFCVSVWYELFGGHPFAGERWDHARALAAMEADRLEDMPRLRGFSARAFRALRRGLRHDPAARWPSMTELIAELEPPSRTGWAIGGASAVALASGAIAMAIVGGVGTAGDPCANAADRLAAVYTPERMHELVGKLTAVKLPYAVATAVRAQAAIDGYARNWTAMRSEACRANRVRRDQSDELFDRRVACLDRSAGALDVAIGVLSTAPTPELLDRAIEVTQSLPRLADCNDAGQLASGQMMPPDPARRARIDRASEALDRARAGVAAGVREGAVAAANKLVAEAREIGWSPLLAHALKQAADAERVEGQLEAAIAHYREASVEAGRGRNTLAALGSLVDVAYTLAENNQPAEALVVATDAEILAKSVGDPPWVRARIEGARARALAAQSRVAEADAAYLAAIAAARADREPEELYLGRLLVDHGDLLKVASQYARAVEALLAARAIFDRLLGPDHPVLASMHMTLGNLYLQLKDVPRGKAEHARALAILEARLSPDHPDVTKARFGLGLAAINEGRLDDAVAAFDDTYRRLAKSQPDQATTYTALYMLATAKLEQGRYDEALPKFEQVLAWRLEKLGENHVSTANVLDAIGKLYQARDDYPNAFINARRALAIREHTLGADNPDVALSLETIAMLSIEQHDCPGATRAAQRALAILDKAKAPPHLQIDAHDALARCDALAGRLVESRVRFEKLLALVDAPDAATIEQSTNARIDFAEMLERAGDRTRARTLVQQALELFAADGRKRDVAEQQAWLAKHPAK